MTREEAIKVLEEEHKQRVDGYISYLAHYGHQDQSEELYLVAEEMAVAALREQEERSKGCPYCLYLEPLCRHEGDIIAIETDGKQYVIEGDYWGFDIKFCPMCGRKLEVEG